ncbi:hypothetical protein K8R33_02350 [archaeon]|nr:hypothetical protein [archaeon]
MKPVAKRDIIDVLRKSLKAIRENDLSSLREQSFRTVHNSSIYQDEYSISISVVLYSIFKVLEKNNYKGHKDWGKFKKSLLAELKQAINALEKDNIKGYGAGLKRVISHLKKLDKNVGMYMEDIIRSTKVKKASNIHGHGLSIGRAADLLGITKWELMPYSGNTRTYEAKYNISKSIKDRILLARGLFGVK